MGTYRKNVDNVKLDNDNDTLLDDDSHQEEFIYLPFWESDFPEQFVALGDSEYWIHVLFYDHPTGDEYYNLYMFDQYG